ncbi:MAG: amidase [Gammaproteobacteria bacterium]|nr:amidase [Gammaproteobacteria bacterium]
MVNPIIYKDASTLAREIRAQNLSAVEVMNAFLEQIARVNPEVNAICTLDESGARASAESADRSLLSGKPVGPLHGLPVAIKDLHATRGMRTTHGSPFFENHVPDFDHLHVARLRQAGAIVIGKTNTPEFGAGSQTFNAVFGTTRNPYDLNTTCGGSSGGAAVAIATGMLPIADGSDMGGSLRNPAAFCNVFGFRPSPGRVPDWPVANNTRRLGVRGPIARSARDIALIMSAIAGPDERVPLSIDEPGTVFSQPLERDFAGTRVAWSPNLGQYEVDEEIIEVCEQALAHFEAAGCEVIRRDPDMHEADEIFQTLRAHSFAFDHRDRYANHKSQLKDTIIWNVEQGLALTGPDVARAEAQCTTLFERTVSFFEDVEFLLCPTTQVLPFSHELDWIREINGVPMKTYIDWMGLCYAITVTGCPAISVPVGFSSGGLPVGMQIVARPKADFSALQLAHAVEQHCDAKSHRPGVAI